MQAEAKNTLPKSEAPIQSVARALGILECFHTHDELRLTEISSLMDLNKSTTYGIVRTLEAYGFLSQDPDTEKYRLGMSIFRLGNNIESPLRSLARISLGTLVQEFGETANLSVRSGDYNIYLEKLESPFSMRICTSPGQLFPLYLTAMGKCMLAYLPPEEVHDILSRTNYVQYTENSLMSSEEVLKELEIIKVQGYAIDNEEREFGLICVAVPVFNKQNELIAALSVSGPAQRMPEEKINEIQKKLRQEALKIQQSL